VALGPVRSWLHWNLRSRLVLTALRTGGSRLDLRIVGRTLLHAALVGLAAGAVV
jgi:hypothetical protein